MDELKSKIFGSETIEYINHSPHSLSYLWVQRDQNALANNSKRQRSGQGPNFQAKADKPAEVDFHPFRRFVTSQEFEGGYQLASVVDDQGNALPHTIVCN